MTKSSKNSIKDPSLLLVTSVTTRFRAVIVNDDVF